MNIEEVRKSRGSHREPDVAIAFRDGRPVIVTGRADVPPLMYCDTFPDVPHVRHGKPDLWLDRNRDFRDSGVHTYVINMGRMAGKSGYHANRFWADDGSFPECTPQDAIFCYDRQAEALIAMDPRARLMARFHEPHPSGWIAAHPDDLQRGENAESIKVPSLASEARIEALCEFLSRLVGYCQAQPWAVRLLGFMMCPLGEGSTALPFAGYHFDVSPVMQRAYRDWIRERYRDDAALAAAWDQPGLTVDDVRVPSETLYQSLLNQSLEIVTGPAWQPIRDYWDLQRTLYLRRYRAITRAVREAMGDRKVLFGLDFCKSAMIGWEHNLSFFARPQRPRYLEFALSSGLAGLAGVLDEPGFDFVWTPADYTARGVGFGWEPEGIADSLRLRGKVMWVENDARSLVREDGDDADTQGAFRDVEETRAGLLRNAAWSLSRGCFDYWMIAGGQYFHHPDVQTHGIVPVRKLVEAGYRLPHRETEHAIAMVIDDESLPYTSGIAEFNNLAIVWQRALGLAHCGIPYRIYLLSDLQRDNMPDFRCYLFPNLSLLTDERLEVLHRKVFRDGRMAIFGPLTGVTDGNRLGSDGVTRLLGVEMELIEKEVSHRVMVGGDHPLAGRLPASLNYGDHLVYGPIVLPAFDAVRNAGATELGMAVTYWFQNRPGLFLLDHGTHKVAWSAAVPLPSCLLRELAREGGCHVWCEEDDVVLASDSIAALHSVKPGKRVLKFPSVRPVWDLLAGRKIGDAMEAIVMNIAPPETRVFYCGTETPFNDKAGK